MPYSSFTLAKVKKEFGLTTVEAGRFLPPLKRSHLVLAYKRF
ncbi:hypothetical protein [Amazonocrinis nigriterrae]|nr:hypothetical protein [Amazonocrinis nigriterrae]